MFQQRKASGMKIAGVAVLTDVMLAVNTGNIIVTAKQMNTAVARNGMRIKSVPRGMDVRAVDDRLRVLVVLFTTESPSDVPFAVAFAADSRASLARAMLLCLRSR